MEDHADIADKIDDYLWIKLCQIQIDGEDRADVLSLQKLQVLLFEDYGRLACVLLFYISELCYI
mgnify:CR=1 FL=1